jgi:hypothetical protein
MVEYHVADSGLPLNSVWGDKLREKIANNSWIIPIRIGSMVTHFQLPPYEYH